MAGRSLDGRLSANEITVPPFIDGVLFGRLPNGQTAKNEGSRAESQVLLSFLTLGPHEVAAIGLSTLLLRNHQIRHHPFQSGTCRLHSISPTRHTSGVFKLQLSPRVRQIPVWRRWWAGTTGYLCRFSGELTIDPNPLLRLLR